MHYFVRVACVKADPQALLDWRGLAGANCAWRAVFVSEWLEYLRTHAHDWLMQHHKYACVPPAWYSLDEVIEGTAGAELLRRTLAPADLFHFAVLYQQAKTCSRAIDHMDAVTLRPYNDARRPVLLRVEQRERELIQRRYGQGRSKRSSHGDASNKTWTEQMLQRNRRALAKLDQDPEWVRLSTMQHRYGNAWPVLRNHVKDHVAGPAWARFLAVAKADVRARRAVWREDSMHEELDEARQALQAAQLLWEDASAQHAHTHARVQEHKRKRAALLAELAPGLDAERWSVNKRPLTYHEMEDFSSSAEPDR